MQPFYLARIEDLGHGDFVKVDCAARHHFALLTPAALLKLGLSPRPSIRPSDAGPLPRVRNQETSCRVSQVGPLERVSRKEGVASGWGNISDTAPVWPDPAHQAGFNRTRRWSTRSQEHGGDEVLASSRVPTPGPRCHKRAAGRSCRSMDAPRRCRARQLSDCIGNPEPNRGAGAFAMRREFVGALGAF
jgi:hypothetical protein